MRKRSRYQWIFSSLFRACGIETAWYFLTMLLAALSGPLSLLLRGKVLDAAIGAEGKLLGAMLGFGVVSALSLLLTYENSVGRQRMRKRLYECFSEEVLEKFSKIKYAAYESERTMNIIQRVGDAPQEHILDFFSTSLEVTSEAVRAFCYALIFVRLSWWCLLSGALFFGILMVFDWKRTRLMVELYEEQTRDERLMESYEKALGNKNTLYDLRVAGAVPYLLKKRKALSDAIVRERYRRTLRSQRVYSCGDLAIVCWMTVVLLFSVEAFLKGRITLGLFVALVGSLQQVIETFRSLGESCFGLQRRAAFAGYYREFMELEEEPAGKEETRGGETGAGIPAAGQGEIRFDHVTFTYPGQSRPALRDVSFEMEIGTRMALVGRNGSGKSTLIKLLCGLYQPDEGHIFIKGQDAMKISPEERKRYFSVIFQNPAPHFPVSKENMELGDVDRLGNPPEKRAEDVKLALHQGLADDLADRLEQSLGNLTEDGVELSGGQWQRLALARACFRDSEILVLDEPTAALDPVAENELYANFTEMLKERSCILISHRLAVTKYVNRILVLQDGKLIEDGNHDSLMKKQGVYASMYEAQSHWYLARKSDGCLS